MPFPLFSLVVAIFNVNVFRDDKKLKTNPKMNIKMRRKTREPIRRFCLPNEIGH